MSTPAVDVTHLTSLGQFLVTVVAEYSLNVVLALVILILGWWASDFFSRLLEKGLARAGIDPTLRPVLCNTLMWVVRVVTIVAVLGQFGVQTTSVIAILGAAGLAIGLALQGTLQNIASGMMLLLLRPFHVGEYIENSAVQGTVDEIGLFATKLTKSDGIYLFVPNSQLWNSALTNYSRNKVRRNDLSVAIRYKDDVRAAMGAMEKLLADDPRILKDPAFLVAVDNPQDGAVVLKLRYWATTSDFWDVRWDLGKKIPAALRAVGCGMALPMRVVVDVDKGS